MRRAASLRRLRSCRYELLEPRQVLSATAAGIIAGLANWKGSLNLAGRSLDTTADPTGFSPAQIREAYNIDGITFSGLLPATSALALGQTLAGPGIRANTTIAAIVNGTTITLSSTATASGTKPIVIGSLVNVTTIAGSDNAAVASTVGLTAGQSLSGPNIAPNTTIATIVDSVTITLSTNATGTGTKPTVIGSLVNLVLTSGSRTARTAASTIRVDNIPADGRGMTIAIIEAGNDPTIIADAAAYSTEFGLQQFNVPGGPTLKVVNQHGSSNIGQLPPVDLLGAPETALDVEWVHAIAPMANILVVEALNPFTGTGFISGQQMVLANQYARTVPGVVVISNSWGGGEYRGETGVDSIFSTPAGHAGLTYVFSAGDDGAPAEYPSASPNVLSVGGTSLTLNGANAITSEDVWSGGGGGASQLISPTGTILVNEGVPNFQKSLGLTGRGTPDVSFNADPETGFSIYDSTSNGTATPWTVIGGTSAGAPAWAALIAIVDQGRAMLGKNSLANAQVAMYSLPGSDFNDITTGSNGISASAGYDLASGLGTPIADLVIRDLVRYNGATLVGALSQKSGILTFGPVFLDFASADANPINDNSPAFGGHGDPVSPDSSDPISSSESSSAAIVANSNDLVATDHKSQNVADVSSDDGLDGLRHRSFHRQAASAEAAVDMLLAQVRAPQFSKLH